MAIVSEEVTKIKKGRREIEDLMKLEKISKIYCAVFACNRENIKSGLLGQLRDQDLNDSEDGKDEAGEAGDTDAEDL